MPLRFRAYGGLTDLAALAAFEVTITAARLPALANWHQGNLIWNLHTGMQGFDPGEPSGRIRLWLGASEIEALAVLTAPDEAHVDVRPDVPAATALWDEAHAWAEARSDRSLAITVLESDVARRKALETRGYAAAGPGGVRMQLGLAAPIATPVLPPGMRLRDCVDVDLEERAAAHRDAWEHLEHIGIVGARSAFSDKVYRGLRAAPVYDPALDLAVQADDGTVVASCICWADDANGIGLFEPVGTREAFRGRGLARALVLNGLALMQSRGLHTALIGTAHFNQPALRVYETSGFETVDRELMYTRGG